MNESSLIFEQVRAQFPALQRTHNGQTCVYFDGPAGTQVPQCVMDAMTKYLSSCNANVGGSFQTARESDELLANAHQGFAEFLNADSGDEVFFGQNMTSLTFSISRAIARDWNVGDEVIVTRLDHDANISPWVLAAQDKGATVHFVEFDRDRFELDLQQFHDLLSEKTRLVAVGAASNATGGINPVREVCVAARNKGAITFVDAVHYAPHKLIDVKEFGCDFLACSAYKFFGPHLGLIWGRQPLLESLRPYKVRPATDKVPGRWMTGTQSHESIAGGLAAVDYLADLGRKITEDNSLTRREALKKCYQSIRQFENELSIFLLEKLLEIEGLKVWGNPNLSEVESRFPTFSITIDGITPADLANELGNRGIFVWNGNYYALEFSEANKLEPDGMVRIGLVHYNTRQEAAYLIDSIKEIVANSLAKR